ncbi:hypothetical protein [Variovorax sp. IB41]|uniref:hypothetical protein n=1 Tax=Variovorax sp. IB41 TaxID=2779370 RepID=UPI0018E86C83|nr:hypothetical protein [Variovorax sp. IB41]MBJ2154233.1 hypothetical protein [Variovorax sp. IB41]
MNRKPASITKDCAEPLNDGSKIGAAPSGDALAAVNLSLKQLLLSAPASADVPALPRGAARRRSVAPVH